MVQSKKTVWIVASTALLLFCILVNLINVFNVAVEPHKPVKNDGTYLVIGMGPQCVQFNGSESPHDELSNLRKITLIECVKLDPENFLEFLEKHFQTIESIYLFNVTIMGNFTRRVYLPNLKTFYLRMTSDHIGGAYFPTATILEPFLFFKKSNSEFRRWKLKEIWKQGVHVTVIVDSKTMLEINQDLGIFKTFLEESADDMLKNMDSNLTDLELYHASLSESSYTKLNKGSLEKVVVRYVNIMNYRSDDFITNKFTNLRIFGCSGFTCSLPSEMSTHSSLKHLALGSLELSKYRIPPTPFVLDSLQLWCDYQSDCEESDLLHRYYQATSVAVRTEVPSIELLGNLLRMDKIIWIHYRFLRYNGRSDKEKFQNFLNTFCECSSALNTKSFILKRNSNSQWIGESLDSHVQINPITGQLSEMTAISMWDFFTLPPDVPNITNNSISSSDELLIVGDVHYQNGTTEEVIETSNWIRNITILEHVVIDAERFLSLLEKNQDSLESIYLKNVRVIGSFNRKVYLPNLKNFTMFIDDKRDVIPADHILESYLFFTTKRGMINWRLNDIWLQGVEVRFFKNEVYDFGSHHPTELVLDYFTGIIKSNVQSSETIVNNALLSGENLSTIALSEIHVSRPPPVDTTAFVSKLILHNIVFENGIDEYIKGFDNLKVLGLSRKYDYPCKYSNVVQNISCLPSTLVRLTLENIYLRFNNKNPSIIDLEELGFSYSLHCPVIIQDVTRTIHKYFNAQRIFLQTGNPEPDLLENAMKMKNVTWIYYEATYDTSDRDSKSQRKWGEFLSEFGLETAEKLILQRLPNSNTWIGQKIDEKEAWKYTCESLEVSLMYLFQSNLHDENCDTA